MPYLIPVQYHRYKYPQHIQPAIQEVAGHFDISKLKRNGKYSLHTEYSYSHRKFNTECIKPYKHIIEANQQGIPKLWFNEQWSIELGEFIVSLVGENEPPSIIEIHPPFSDYSNIPRFIENYKVFHSYISKAFPDTNIFIENRSGSRYRKGKFIVSNVKQLMSLSEMIDQKNISLKITLDLPQLFTAHGISPSKKHEMIQLFTHIKSIRHNIAGIHLWGKKIGISGRKITHQGDLNDYFNNLTDFKQQFLQSMYEAFDDEKKRYFVPEVNSCSEDLQSIIQDLENSGFNFV